tara:strand:- start:12212 stop:12688 length:477 start_codon:yes stop_codon:yes gene_type:complete
MKKSNNSARNPTPGGNVDSLLEDEDVLNKKKWLRRRGGMMEELDRLVKMYGNAIVIVLSAFVAFFLPKKEASPKLSKIKADLKSGKPQVDEESIKKQQLREVVADRKREMELKEEFHPRISRQSEIRMKAEKAKLDFDNSRKAKGQSRANYKSIDLER